MPWYRWGRKGRTRLADELTLSDISDPATLKDKTDAQLYGIIRDGKDKMPAEVDRMNPQDGWSLIAYVRSLSAGKIKKQLEISRRSSTVGCALGTLLAPRQTTPDRQLLIPALTCTPKVRKPLDCREGLPEQLQGVAAGVIITPLGLSCRSGFEGCFSPVVDSVYDV